jgi:hypothetical protein
MDNDEKLAAAWNYLNERRISILRHGFIPTNAASTDVRTTVNRYRGSVMPTIPEFPMLRRAK